MKRASLASLLATVLALCGAALAADPVPVKITQGPRVEYTSSNSAIIAWSTDRPASSVVHYGVNGGLDQTARSPYTSGTHRVTVRNLQPGTNYSFQVESGQARGNGSDVRSGVMTFATRGVANPNGTPTGVNNDHRRDHDHDADDRRRNDGDHDADDQEKKDNGKHKGWYKNKNKDKDKAEKQKEKDENKKDKDKDGDHDH